jgi:hypothetical protein
LAHRGVSGGSRAAGTALPPRAATVGTKTPATATNNQQSTKSGSGNGDRNGDVNTN